MALIGPIGAHAPAAGGLAKAALPYLDATAAKAVQVFVSNPRGWALSPGDPREDDAFQAGCAERSVPAYIHAALLVNLGSPTPATVTRSAETLAHGLLRGARIGARGVVFHAGSAVDDGYAATALRQVREALLPLLDAAAAAAGRGCWWNLAPEGAGASPPEWRTSVRTWRPWTGIHGSGSASIPATPGRPGTTSRRPVA
jgi:deoxyribonuclease-4